MTERDKEKKWLKVERYWIYLMIGNIQADAYWLPENREQTIKELCKEWGIKPKDVVRQFAPNYK